MQSIIPEPVCIPLMIWKDIRINLFLCTAQLLCYDLCGFIRIVCVCIGNVIYTCWQLQDFIEYICQLLRIGHTSDFVHGELRWLLIKYSIHDIADDIR